MTRKPKRIRSVYHVTVEVRVDSDLPGKLTEVEFMRAMRREPPFISVLGFGEYGRTRTKPGTHGMLCYKSGKVVKIEKVRE